MSQGKSICVIRLHVILEKKKTMSMEDVRYLSMFQGKTCTISITLKKLLFAKLLVNI